MIKRKKGWMLKHGFFTVATIYVITSIKFFLPIKSALDFFEKLGILLLVLGISGVLIYLLGALMTSSIAIENNQLVVTKGFKKRTYDFSEVSDYKFKELKRNQNGRLGDQLNIVIAGKEYVYHSQTYDGVDRFAKELSKYVSCL